MYLAHYDNTNGKVLGFYIQGLHTNIPIPTLKITAEQHQEYFNKGQNHKVIDGEFVYVEPELQAPQIVTPAVDPNVADLWEAMLNMSAELETLKKEG